MSPRINVPQHEVLPTRQPSSALMNTSFATQEFRALAELGGEITRVGSVIQEMQKLDAQKEVMNADVEVSSFLSERDNPEWIKKNVGEDYTDENGAVVKRIPESQYAERYRKDYEDKINSTMLKFKSVPGQSAEQWKANQIMNMHRKMGSVVRTQHGLIKEANSLAFHKQSLVAMDDLANITLTATPEELNDAYGNYTDIIKLRGEGSGQSGQTILKLQLDGKARIGEAAETMVEQAIDRGDIETAKRGYEILREFGQIESAEYKKETSELANNIVLHQAEKNVYSDSAGNVKQGLISLGDMDADKLSLDQIKKRRSLTSVAEKQLDRSRHGMLAGIVLDMDSNGAVSLADKQSEASKYRQRLADYTSQLGENISLEEAKEIRIMSNRINSWLTGDKIKTNKFLRSNIQREIRKLNNLSSAGDVQRIDELINSGANELDESDFTQLKGFLDNRLSVTHASVIENFINLAEISVEDELLFEMALRKRIADSPTLLGAKDVYLLAQDLVTLGPKATMLEVGREIFSPNKTTIPPLPATENLLVKDREYLLKDGRKAKWNGENLEVE